MIKIEHWDGSFLLGLRASRLWSQEELARRVGTPRTNIHKWENGERKPSLDKFFRLMREFGYDIVLAERSPFEARDTGEERETERAEETGGG